MFVYVAYAIIIAAGYICMSVLWGVFVTLMNLMHMAYVGDIHAHIVVRCVIKGIDYGLFAPITAAIVIDEILSQNNFGRHFNPYLAKYVMSGRSSWYTNAKLESYFV